MTAREVPELTVGMELTFAVKMNVDLGNTALTAVDMDKWNMAQR